MERAIALPWHGIVNRCALVTRDSGHSGVSVIATGRFVPFLLLFISGFALSGCAVGGAPSISLFGAYFPAWMLAAFVGILVAILSKLLLVSVGLESVMPWQLAVCSGVGMIAAIGVGLLVFG